MKDEDINLGSGGVHDAVTAGADHGTRPLDLDEFRGAWGNGPGQPGAGGQSGTTNSGVSNTGTGTVRMGGGWVGGKRIEEVTLDEPDGK